MLGHMRKLSTETGITHGKFESPFTPSQRKVAVGLERYIDENAMRALPSAAGGVTRSFIAIDTTFTVHEHTLDCAAILTDDARALFERTRHTNTSTFETDRRTCETLGYERQEARRKEPLCTPAARLAIGIRLNEALRRVMERRKR